jgi:hypothetical protein
MVFAFDGDTNFSDKPVHKTVHGVLPDPIEFEIEYPDGIRQKYAIRLDYLIGFAGPMRTTRVTVPHSVCAPGKD